MHDSSTQSASHAAPLPSDLFIAGAGPAGLACAIAAAQYGLSVEIADGMSPPIDKACGEGLLPNTVAVLASLGIPPASLHAAVSHPFHGIRFIGPRKRSGTSTLAEARFSVPPGLDSGMACGFGIERTTLHQLLLDRAAALGVRIHWKTVVQTIESSPAKPRNPLPTTIHTNRSTHHARFLIGADGHASRIRTFAGLNHGRVTARRFGLRQHFHTAPWSTFVEVYWSDRGEAYVTPVGSNKICIAFLARDRFTCVTDALKHFPELQDRLSAAQPADTPRGAISLSRRLHRVTTGNIALLGDASGSIDAITGEGLSLAFHQAQCLASALRKGDLSSYQRDHNAINRLPSLMSRAMLLLDRSPLLRDITLSAFAAHSTIFNRLLRLHTATQTPLPAAPASDLALPAI